MTRIVRVVPAPTEPDAEPKTRAARRPSVGGPMAGWPDRPPAHSRYESMHAPSRAYTTKKERNWDDGPDEDDL